MAQQAIVTPRPMPAARPRKAPAKQAAAVTKDTTKRETRRVASTAKSEAKQRRAHAHGYGRMQQWVHREHDDGRGHCAYQHGPFAQACRHQRCQDSHGSSADTECAQDAANR